ncbi:MAG: DUF4230 domain-containing protein [Spirochaetes bacterium]|nr:DUF4230 domain-containing protein [Spirochaetota bacterium]
MRTLFLALTTLFILLTVGCQRFPSLLEEELSTRIRAILELPSVEYRYKEIVYVGEQKSFLFLPTSNKEVLFSVEIRVQAGVDLQQPFTVKRDIRNPRKIHVTLPPAKILLLDVDETTIQQYFVVEQGSRIHRMDYSKELESAKQRILQDALKRGILTEAEQQTRILIKGILETAGFEAGEVGRS